MLKICMISVILSTIASLCNSYLIFETPVLTNVNPVEDDICSDSISLESMTFNFFDVSYNSLWVCNNGIITFDYADPSYVPDPFPIEGNAMVTPFWSDIDNRGNVSESGDSNANSISWELSTDPEQVDKVNTLIEQTVNAKGFTAKWVFTATWYKVGYYLMGTNLLNTFQVVLACDRPQDASQAARCFCLFAYEDIQWTNNAIQESHAQAGFNDGRGDRHEDLPTSRTAEMRNLPLMSNVGKNGLFVYELSSSLGCTNLVEPYFANMFFEKQNFLLNNVNCGGKLHPNLGNTIEVLFMGKSFSRTVTGNIIDNRKSVKGVIPFWGKAETVHVGIYRDGVFDIRQSMTMHFVHETSSESEEIELLNVKEIEENGNMTVEFTWNKDHFNKSRVAAADGNIALKILVVQLPPNELRGPFVFEAKQVHVISNARGNATVEIEPNDGVSFLQLDLMPEASQLPPPCSLKISLNDCTENALTSRKVAFTRSLEFDCNQWIETENSIIDINREYGNTPWKDNLEKLFGCPRNFEDRAGETDANFARREAENGLIGWRYDPCCGGDTNYFGYDNLCPGGETTKCLLNDGTNSNPVEFCIQSPTMLLQELDINSNVVQISASNQCCYSDGGDLVKLRSQDTGSSRKSSFTAGNFVEFYLTEIPPRKHCTKQQYYEHRPETEGVYEPRIITINWGDPHITTLDGVQYTYNGLGVYVLMRTLDSHPSKLQVQISTRRVGNGTVFSGCSLRDTFASVEFYVSSANHISLLVGGTEVDFSRLATLNTNEVEYSRNDVSTEFQFKLIDSDFIMKILVNEAGLLNFVISPPFDFESNVEGLLGNFDGIQENDLVSRGGLVVPIVSTLEVIDAEFGDSWKVPEEDWIFSGNAAASIKEDIISGTPYIPDYVSKFKNEESKIQAEEVCDGDQRCLLDVSLTGEIAFATNFVQMRQKIEAVELLNEAALAARRKKKITDESRRMLEEFDGRLTVFSWGCMHFTTFDGLQYTFNGLGVYTFTQTAPISSKFLTVQASTRRIGNCTAFSGFLLKDMLASVEIYLDAENNIEIFYNGFEQITELSSLHSNSLEFSKNKLSTEYFFNFMDSQFLVKIFHEPKGVINFAVSPPVKRAGDLHGLLGNFDGSLQKELKTEGGEVFPANFTSERTYNEFGETWAVAEQDWLFSKNTQLMIKDDISIESPNNQINTIQFYSDNLGKQAKETCGNHSLCLWDVESVSIGNSNGRSDQRSGQSQRH